MRSIRILTDNSTPKTLNVIRGSCLYYDSNIVEITDAELDRIAYDYRNLVKAFLNEEGEFKRFSQYLRELIELKQAVTK